MTTTEPHRHRSRSSENRRRFADDDEPVYVISVAARQLGIHPQTLRSYERQGLVRPARTAGGNRLYSRNDLTRLRRILELTAEGLTLAGVAKVLALEERIARLQRPSTSLVRRDDPVLPPRPGHTARAAGPVAEPSRRGTGGELP